MLFSTYVLLIITKEVNIHSLYRSQTKVENAQVPLLLP